MILSLRLSVWKKFVILCVFIFFFFFLPTKTRDQAALSDKSMMSEEHVKVFSELAWHEMEESCWKQT